MGVRTFIGPNGEIEMPVFVDIVESMERLRVELAHDQLIIRLDERLYLDAQSVKMTVRTIYFNPSAFKEWMHGRSTLLMSQKSVDHRPRAALMRSAC